MLFTTKESEILPLPNASRVNRSTFALVNHKLHLIHAGEAWLFLKPLKRVVRMG